MDMTLRMTTARGMSAVVTIPIIPLSLYTRITLPFQILPYTYNPSTKTKWAFMLWNLSPRLSSRQKFHLFTSHDTSLPSSCHHDCFIGLITWDCNQRNATTYERYQTQ